MRQPSVCSCVERAGRGCCRCELCGDGAQGRGCLLGGCEAVSVCAAEIDERGDCAWEVGDWNLRLALEFSKIQIAEGCKNLVHVLLDAVVELDLLV